MNGLVQGGHAQSSGGAIDHQFPVFAAEGFGDVAVPADGPVGAENFLEVLGRNVVPLDGFAFGINQSGRMIVPVDGAEGFVAVDTILTLIPPVDDGPDEAGLGRFLDLPQALLSAALHFGPTRAIAQLQVLVAEGCPTSGLPCGHPDSRGFVIFRTGDDAFATELQVRVQSATQTYENKDSGGGRYHYQDEFHGRFLSGAIPGTTGALV